MHHQITKIITFGDSVVDREIQSSDHESIWNIANPFNRMMGCLQVQAGDQVHRFMKMASRGKQRRSEMIAQMVAKHSKHLYKRLSKYRIAYFKFSDISYLIKHKTVWILGNSKQSLL